MKENDETDALWDLMGHASRQEASPYFARKVLRALEQEKASRLPSLFQVLRWLIPTSACAAIAFGWFAYQEQEQAQFNAYFDSAADMQSLVAQEDPSSWITSDN